MIVECAPARCCRVRELFKLRACASACVAPSSWSSSTYDIVTYAVPSSQLLYSRVKSYHSVHSLGA